MHLYKTALIANPFGLTTGHLMLLSLLLIPFSVSLSSIVLVILLFAVVVEGELAGKWQRFIASPFTPIFIVGFVLIALSSFFSMSTWGESLYVLKKYLWLLLTPYLLASVDLSSVEGKLLKYFIVAVTIATLVANFNYWFGFDFAPHGRITTFFQDRIKHSYLVLVALVLVISELRLKRNLTFNLSCFAVLLSNLVYINDARTGYVMLLLIFLIAFFYELKNFRTKLLLAVGFTVTLLMMGGSDIVQYGIHNTVNSIKSYQAEKVNRTSIGVRADQWYFGFKAFEKKSLRGYGTGSAGRVINDEQRSLTETVMHERDIPPLVDCGFVNILVQWGVLGVLYFICLMGFLFKASRQLPPQYRYIFVNLLLINLVGNFSNNWFATTIPSHLFVFFMVFFFAKNKEWHHGKG